MAPRRRFAAALAVAVAALAVATSALSGAEAVACPATTGAYNGYNKEDVVKVWSKTCDEDKNYQCDACDLWNSVRKVTAPYAYSGGKKYRSKILPTKPVTGIESIVNGSYKDDADKATYFLWTKAMNDFIAGAPETKADGTKYPVAMLNGLAFRSRHQLHIHVGQLHHMNFVKCVQKDILANPPAPKVWKDVTAASLATDACQKLHYGKASALAITATEADGNQINARIRDGFRKISNGDIATDLKLSHTGAVVTPHPTKSGAYLVYLVTGANDYSIFGDDP
jgi:hypothetical protein